jgi:hypothetical protein
MLGEWFGCIYLLLPVARAASRLIPLAFGYSKQPPSNIPRGMLDEWIAVSITFPTIALAFCSPRGWTTLTTHHGSRSSASLLREHSAWNVAAVISFSLPRRARTARLIPFALRSEAADYAISVIETAPR